MKEYVILDSSPKKQVTQDLLNEHALNGWVVVGFTEHQILMEREREKGDAEQAERFLLSD